MSKFLERFLETGKFPEAVCDYVVGAFSGRYLQVLTRNPSFNGYGATLLASAKTGDLTALLSTGDVSALNAILDSLDAILAWEGCNENLLKLIVELWCLSDSDQLRLVRRNLSDEFCKWLLDNYAIAPATRRHLFRNNGPLSQVLRDAPTRETSELRERNTWQHTRHPEIEESAERVRASREYRTELYGSDKGKLSRLSIVGRLDDTAVYLSGEFGLGDSAESMSQWRTFFKIAGSGCDAPLTNVIRTAKILALSK